MKPVPTYYQIFIPNVASDLYEFHQVVSIAPALSARWPCMGCPDGASPVQPRTPPGTGDRCGFGPAACCAQRES